MQALRWWQVLARGGVAAAHDPGRPVLLGANRAFQQASMDE